MRAGPPLRRGVEKGQCPVCQGARRIVEGRAPWQTGRKVENCREQRFSGQRVGKLSSGHSSAKGVVKTLPPWVGLPASLPQVKKDAAAGFCEAEACGGYAVRASRPWQRPPYLRKMLLQQGHDFCFRQGLVEKIGDGQLLRPR